MRGTSLTVPRITCYSNSMIFNLYKKKMAKGNVASNKKEANRILHKQHNICGNKSIFRFITL